MTREEVIKFLQWYVNNASISSKGFNEACQMALAALRPVSRERVEQVWRGEWIGMTDDDGCTWYECSRCEYDLDSLEEPNHFCPSCGALMTDEAVDIVLRRLEALHETAE